MKVRYVPQYTVQQIYASASGGSDHVSFIRRKYRGFSTLSYSITPEYHKRTDDFAHISIPYCTDFVKPILGMLMVVAGNKNAFFEHKPLQSTADTACRNVWTLMKLPNRLPVTEKHGSPKLYYKINSLPYVGISAYYSNQDTFKFRIPGAPKGSAVRYYFAAQDSVTNFVCTYPIGGSGVNPPGSTPPEKSFGYSVYNYVAYCSKTLPKPIEDRTYTRDSIYISGPELVNRLSVNLWLSHQNDGDLVIQLFGPGGIGMVNLASQNGEGGQNFTNTTFSDTASRTISQGTPPFTGYFKPVAPLSFFNGKPVEGYWVLRIFDLKEGNTGTLNHWCLQMETRANVGVEENTVPVKYELSQNYPNPFNNSTRLKFAIAKTGNVKITVYDVLGRHMQTLVNEVLQPGTYNTSFDASMLSSGVYFYRMEAGDFTDVKRFVVLK
jgi:subtilisin-like proprotein convertase family protein